MFGKRNSFVNGSVYSVHMVSWGKVDEHFYFFLLLFLVLLRLLSYFFVFYFSIRLDDGNYLILGGVWSRLDIFETRFFMFVSMFGNQGNADIQRYGKLLHIFLEGQSCDLDKWRWMRKY